MAVTTVVMWLSLGLTIAAALPWPLPSGSGIEDSDWEDPSPEEGPFLEGDIVTGSEVIPIAEFKPSHRLLGASPRLLWPHKTLYYELPGHIQGQLRALVEEALRDIQEQSCVRFAPRDTQTTYLRLKDTGKGCNSKVGYPEEEGPQTLQVGGRKCHTLGTVQHELLHALGLWHEHTRPDRDKHVTVLWDNVRPDRKSNFIKRDDEDAKVLLELPYDYGSVMHYKATSFSKYRGSSTLVPRAKEAVKVMGQRVGMTKGDVAKLNRLYNCTGGHYRGEDLVGRKFLCGKYHKVSGIYASADSGEDLDFGNDPSIKNKNTDGLLGLGDKRLKEEIKIKKGNIDLVKDRAANESEIISDYVDKHVLNVSSVVDEIDEKESIKKNKLIPNPNLNGRLLMHFHGFKSENETTSKVAFEENCTILKETSVNESGKDNETVKNKPIVEAKNTFGEFYMRIKRETAGTKSQRDAKGEVAEQEKNENHESFAPQKILPELLKGVLNTENDRPIVIQFAIYQPIVYKSSNKTEPSEEDKKSVDASDEEKNNENRRVVKSEKEADFKDRDNERNDKSERRILSNEDQQNQHFTDNHDEDTRFSNKKILSELADRQYEDNTDRIDVRTINSRPPNLRREEWIRNEETELKPTPQEKLINPSEKQFTDHKTEYFPLSEDHEVKVSKKDFILPSDSHINGEDYRVSQTDYKIERKVFKDHADTSFQVYTEPPVDVIDSNPERQEHLHSNLEHHHETHFHDEKQFIATSPEKDYIQPLKVPQKDNGYESSSLIHFNEGKGTKSPSERSYGLSNSFRGELHEEHLTSQNYHDGIPLQYQAKNDRIPDNRDVSDVAPNFHEHAADDQDKRKSKVPTKYDSTRWEEVTEIIEYHSPLIDEEAPEPDNYKKRINEEREPSELAKAFTGGSAIARGNVRKDTSEEKFVRVSDVDNLRDEKSSTPRLKENPIKVNPKVSQMLPKTRIEELWSTKRVENQETANRHVEKVQEGTKERSRPDIVTDDVFPSDLDRHVKVKTQEKMTSRNQDSLVRTSQKQGQPIIQGEIRDTNRAQMNTKNFVVRKKVSNSRLDQQDQQEDFNEEDLISKPKTSKLNLNPRQALPLQTSVKMEISSSNHSKSNRK